MGDFEKLLKYAEDRDVAVRFVRMVGGFGIAAYDLQMNEIHLDWKGLSRKDPQTLYILAHELGHQHDFAKRGDEYYVAMNTAGGIFEECMNSGLQTPKEIVGMITISEEKAFDYGEQILEKAGVKLKKIDMKRWRNEAMSIYRKSFKGLKWKKFLS